MGIKYIEHKNGTSTPDKVAVEYAVRDSAGNVIKDTYYLATNPQGYTTNTGTVTSVAASGSGGISISGSPITTNGTLAIGLNLSTAINGLGEGTSPAQRNDYIVAQYAGGGTTTTTYHRRKLSNIFAALAASDIPTLTSAKISDFDGAVDTSLGINTSSGDTTKFLNAKGAWAVPYTHPTYDTASAAAVKIGRDATGHVVIGNALTAADVGAAASDHTHTQLENSLTLLKSSTNPGNSYELIFQRGTLTDSYNDWRIQDREGFLRFDQKGSGSSDWSQQVYFNTSGTVYATAFSGNGASLTDLNASNISSGTLADGRLPSTVEKVANKVTSITSASTATQYPSAKAVYDLISSSSIPSILVTANYTYEGGGYYSFTGYSVTGPTVSELYNYAQTSGNRTINFNYYDIGEYGQSNSIAACTGYISYFNYDTPPTAVTIFAYLPQGGVNASDFYVNLTDDASTTTVTKTVCSSVTSINSSSTNSQYPSALAVYNLVSNHSHYWANVSTAASSSTETSPTFADTTVLNYKFRQSGTTTVKAQMAYDSTEDAVKFTFV